MITLATLSEIIECHNELSKKLRLNQATSVVGMRDTINVLPFPDIEAALKAYKRMDSAVKALAEVQVTL
mgnify:FL=1